MTTDECCYTLCSNTGQLVPNLYFFETLADGNFNGMPVCPCFDCEEILKESIIEMGVGIGEYQY